MNEDNKAIEAQTTKEHKAPIVAANAVKFKAPLGKRILKSFIEDDLKDIGSWVLKSKIIPGLKNYIYDIISGSIDRAFLGASASTRKSGGYIGSTPPRIGGSNYNPGGRPSTAPRPVQKPNLSDYERIMMSSRDDAQEVLDQLVQEIIDYGAVSVGELFDLVGHPTTPEDFKYGWKALDTADIVKTPDGWWLKFPKIIFLNQ